MTCPNPSEKMLEGRASWRYGCDCPSCTELREDFFWRRPRNRILTTDVDEIAVERAVMGQRNGIKLNQPERWEAFLALDRLKLSASQIAERIGVQPRAVQNYRRLKRLGMDKPCDIRFINKEARSA